MSKKELLKILDTSSYFSLISAAILVLIFEFTANLLIFKISLVLFAAAFLILCVLCSMKIVYMKKQTTENDEILVDKNKENIVWIIVRLVFSIIFFVLMITFLCFF